MPPKVRPRRDFRGLELRRRAAARRFARGESQAEVAHALSVSRQSVSRWYQQWHAGGGAALRSAGRAGRKPRLAAEQLAEVEAALRRGAGANGFATELWTLPRVAQVIARETGVSYHPGHVWRILRALHWTLQRPARRAAERDEAAIRQWVRERWPAVKKTPDAAAP
jgi:transposase